MASRRILLTACPHRADLRVRETQATRCRHCTVTEHLRLCTACGETFCCESDNAHNQDHFRESGHAIIASVPTAGPHRFLWCWKCHAYLVEEEPAA